MSVPFNLACGTCRNCHTTGGRRPVCGANPSGKARRRVRVPSRWGRTGAAAGRVPARAVGGLQPARELAARRASTSGTSRCCRTSSRPATTAPSWPASSRGGTVAIFGAGPVGLMAAGSAPASAAPRRRSWSTSSPTGWPWPRRWAATPVNLAQAGRRRGGSWKPPAGFGVHCGVEAVGYQAHDPAGDREEPAAGAEPADSDGAADRRARRARPVRAVRSGRGSTSMRGRDCC